MLLTLAVSLALQGTLPQVESVFQQIAPMPIAGKTAKTTNPAVVLIHGYYFHLLDRHVSKPAFRPWQRSDGALVSELGKFADVFVFAYGQNASIDAIVTQSKLSREIAELRKRGYTEIVLVGHSAGGLIARQFVEDNPDAGVSRVVQVCAPNGGSPLATLKVAKSQRVFLDCLSQEGRKESLNKRANKVIPAKVQFVCVVGRGDGTTSTDGVVPCVNQWTPDLQKQGIPAVGILSNHHQIVRDPDATAALARIIRGTHTRWTAEQTATGRKVLFGE